MLRYPMSGALESQMTSPKGAPSSSSVGHRTEDAGHGGDRVVLVSEREAYFYEIGNDQTVGSLLAEMRDIATKVQVRILADVASGHSRPGPHRPSPENRHGSVRRKS